MIHEIKCVCGHLLNVEDVYQSGRVDERCKVKDVYKDGFNNGHLIGEEVGKKKGYEQGMADGYNQALEDLYEKIKLHYKNYKCMPSIYLFLEFMEQLKEKNNG